LLKGVHLSLGNRQKSAKSTPSCQSRANCENGSDRKRLDFSEHVVLRSFTLTRLLDVIDLDEKASGWLAAGALRASLYGSARICSPAEATFIAKWLWDRRSSGSGVGNRTSGRFCVCAGEYHGGLS